MTSAPTTKPVRQVSSVARALHIVELLIAHPQHELGISEIARTLGIGKSTAHQLVATLVAHGFLDRAEASTRYRLGTRLMEGGAVAAEHVGLGPAVTPILEDLVRRVGETSSIGIMASREIVLIHRVEAKSVLRVDLKIGTRFPLHNSAIGRVILSAMPENSRHQLISEMEISDDDRNAMNEALTDAQHAGHAIVRNIPVEGINAIAVAVRGKHGQPVAGLVIAGPSFRFEPEDYSDIAAETAALISERIGVQSIS
jgi:DNA-binding IclR family transcriptional regulator